MVRGLGSTRRLAAVVQNTRSTGLHHWKITMYLYCLFEQLLLEKLGFSGKHTDLFKTRPYIHLSSF